MRQSLSSLIVFLTAVLLVRSIVPCCLLAQSLLPPGSDQNVVQCLCCCQGDCEHDESVPHSDPNNHSHRDCPDCPFCQGKIVAITTLPRELCQSAIPDDQFEQLEWVFLKLPSEGMVVRFDFVSCREISACPELPLGLRV